MICAIDPNANWQYAPDFLFKLFEELKTAHATSVVCFYGESYGIDDIGVEPPNRNIRLEWVPYNAVRDCRPIVRVMWQGKLRDLLVFDMSMLPTVITVEEASAMLPDKPGFFMWGDVDMLECYKHYGSLDPRKWKSE